MPVDIKSSWLNFHEVENIHKWIDKPLPIVQIFIYFVFKYYFLFIQFLLITIPYYSEY